MPMNPYLSDDPPPCGQGCECPECLGTERDEQEALDAMERWDDADEYHDWLQDQGWTGEVEE